MISCGICFGLPFIISLFTNAAATERPKEIPVRFQGAGCNLKYIYSRTPQDKWGCYTAKAEFKEGTGHDNDNFIRVTRTEIGGIEWGCSVKDIENLLDLEVSFTGECSDEGVTYFSKITLILRPGNRLIVHEVVSGLHAIDVYHLRVGWK